MEVKWKNNLLQRFIRGWWQVQVKPYHSPIQTTNNDMITAGVNIHSGNPSTTRQKSCFQNIKKKVMRFFIYSTTIRTKYCLNLKHKNLRFTIACLTRWYTRMYCFDATNRKGLLGWKEAHCMSPPLFLLKGCWEFALLNWWMRTAADPAFGLTVTK